MKKLWLSLALLLGFQVSASSYADSFGGDKKEKERGVTFAARFIEAADLEYSSPIIDAVKDYVGATGGVDKWKSSQVIMAGQIAEDVIRRVLFFWMVSL